MDPDVTQFHLTTRWSLDAPVGSVWAELARPEAWPQWWKGMSDVRLLEEGDSSGMGAYRRITWKGVLPSRFTFNMRTVKVQLQVTNAAKRPVPIRIVEFAEQ